MSTPRHTQGSAMPEIQKPAPYRPAHPLTPAGIAAEMADVLAQMERDRFRTDCEYVGGGAWELRARVRTWLVHLCRRRKLKPAKREEYEKRMWKAQRAPDEWVRDQYQQRLASGIAAYQQAVAVSAGRAAIIQLAREVESTAMLGGYWMTAEEQRAALGCVQEGLALGLFEARRAAEEERMRPIREAAKAKAEKWLADHAAEFRCEIDDDGDEWKRGKAS